MPIFLSLWMAAFAAGPHVSASQAALLSYLGPDRTESHLITARDETVAALADPTESADPATWIHATRMYGLMAAEGGGNAEAVEEVLRVSRKAVELGADPERAAQEVQKVSLKLTRVSLNATLQNRRKGIGSPADAYAWAERALRLDKAAEDFGFPIPAQRASTLAVAANAAVDADNVAAATQHYKQMRDLGFKDAGVARDLARHMASIQGVDAAVEWLAKDLEEERDDVSLLEVQSDLLIEADRADDAIDALQPYMAVFEGNFEAWELLGRTQFIAGQADQARASLQRCLALAPDEVLCLWGRAKIPYRLARGIKVVATDRKSKKKSENYQRRRQLYKEALEYLERAREQEPNNISVNAALLAIYTDFEDKAKIEALQP